MIILSIIIKLYFLLISFRSISEGKVEESFIEIHEIDTIQTQILKPSKQEIKDKTETKDYQMLKSKKKKRKKRQFRRRRCVRRRCNMVRYS